MIPTRLTYRMTTPLPSPYLLGHIVNVDFGVQGVVVGILRAPADELLPESVFVEVAIG